MEVFYKIVVLKTFAKFTAKHLYLRLFIVKLQTSTYNFTEKETLAQLLFCKFCEIFQNTFFDRTLSPLSLSILSRQLRVQS